MDTETSQLRVVDEVDEVDVCSRRDALIQLALLGDGVARVVEVSPVDIRRTRYVEEIGLSEAQVNISRKKREYWAHLKAELLSSPP